MHLEAEIEDVCDAPGGHNQASLKMYSEAMFVQTWRPRLSAFGDALGLHDRWRLRENLEVVNLRW